MASNLPVQSGFSLVWKTKIFDHDTSLESREFDFLNSKWNLKIVSYHNNASNETYLNLNLINWNKRSPCEPFVIRTSLENKCTGKQIYCSTKNVNSSFVTLYGGTFAFLCENKNRNYVYDATVFCVFYLSSGQSLDTIFIKSDESTQTPAEDEYQMEDSDTPADNSIICTSANITKLPLNLQSHLKTLSEDMSDMLQNNIMTDVQLKCGEVVIPAHKAVLSSRSRVFSAMFQHEMLESISNTVDIKDIEPSILCEFLKYLYTGMVSEVLPSETYPMLYKASDRYEVQKLQEECANIMAKKLNEENFVELLMLGEEHDDQKLKDAVSNFIIGLPMLLKMNIWITFSRNFPKLANEIYEKYIENSFSK